MEEKNKNMNVLLACDSNYVMPLTVCLTSLFENNKNTTSVYIFYSLLLAEEIKIISKHVEKYKQKVTFINISNSYFRLAPTLRWTKETYYRLLVCDLLPPDIERLLYLDCDIIVNKPIGELYDLDLEGNYLAALEEKNNKPRIRLGLDPAGKYFQGGVILFDLKKCRQILSYEKANDTICKLGNKILAVDQDVINVMFDGKIRPIDKRFNDCEITNFEKNNLARLLNQADNKTVSNTYIFHYITGKPWNNLYSGACEEIWYRYLKLSPFKDLYTKKYGKFRHRILSTGIMKLIFYKYINLTPHIDSLAKKIFSKNLYTKIRKYYRKKIK